MRFLCPSAIALAMVWPIPSRAQGRPAAPLLIDTVIVITHDVFDTTEARENVLFAVANAIRFKTRPEVVRHELLFHPGEPLDSARLAETERNLRALGLFRSVVIDTVRVNDRLGVLVETRDGWTTELQLNARSTGGEFTWSAGLEERDFLGTATAVGVRYRDDPDRTALTLNTRVNRPLASRALIEGSYDDRSDGKLGEWQVGLPYRAFSDPFGVTLSGEAGRLRVLQFRDGLRADSIQRRALVQRVDASLAARTSGEGYFRVGLLGQVKREAYVANSDTLLAIPDSVSGATGVVLDWRRARFRVVNHYNGFARDEDIDLSTRAQLRLWVAPAALGYAQDGAGPDFEAQTGIVFGAGFARWEVKANALFTSDRVDSARVWTGLTIASLALSRQATVLRLEAGVRSGLPVGAEFDLGHGLGPRAFGSHAFTGTRSVWGTLEHRWFAIDEVWRLLGVGFAGFVDVGGAWYADEPARIGGDIGGGLRLGATRATGANVGRVDLAYRFGDGWTGGRWILSLGRAYTF